MKTWPIFTLVFLFFACGPSASDSGQSLAERFCVSDDRFISTDESFSDGSLSTFSADKIEITLPFGSLNSLHQELGLPIKMGKDMPHTVYMSDFMGMLNQKSCFCTLLIDIEYNGQQKELVLMRVSGNTLTPVSILAGDYTFAECTVGLSSSFAGDDIEVVKEESCMGEAEEPVKIRLAGKLK